MSLFLFFECVGEEFVLIWWVFIVVSVRRVKGKIRLYRILKVRFLVKIFYLLLNNLELVYLFYRFNYIDGEVVKYVLIK